MEGNTVHTIDSLKATRGFSTYGTYYTEVRRAQISIERFPLNGNPWSCNLPINWS